MARRRCGLAGDPNYETGVDGEKKVQRALQRLGYATRRAACSLGKADIEAEDPLTGEVFHVQVKTTSIPGNTPRISRKEREALRDHADREGARAIVAFVAPGRRHRFEDA